MIQNEWLKLSKKKSFWINVTLTAATCVIATILLHRFSTSTEHVHSGVAYAAGMLGVTGVGQLITVLATIATAGLVSQEYAQGTIKFLLIRSRSRGAIFASKYVALVLYTLMLTGLAGLSLYVAGGMAFGFGGTGEQWLSLLQAGAYGFVYAIVYVTLAFMIGTLTRSTGVAIGVGLASTMVSGIMIFRDFYKYALFPNTDLSVYEMTGPPLPGMSVGSSLIVLAVYIALFVGAGYTVFRRRDVA